MITCDVIKCSYRQSKDGFVVSFVVHPQDMPVDLASADIGSQWRMLLVPLDENGNATTEKEAPTDDTGTNATVTEKALRRGPHLQESAVPVSRLTKEAGRLCKDPRFQAFLRSRYPDKWRLLNLGEPTERTRLIVHDVCDITSRKEIIPGTPAGDRWEHLYGLYLGEMWECDPSRNG